MYYPLCLEHIAIHWKMATDNSRIYETPLIELIKIELALRILEGSNPEGEKPDVPGGGGD